MGQLRELAATHARYGYRRLTVLRRREGWKVNANGTGYRQQVATTSAAPGRRLVTVVCRAICRFLCSQPSPLGRILLLVREGSILPLGPIVQSASATEDPLEVRVYGGKDADFELYEDGGDGYGYEHGARATILLHWNDREKTLTIGKQSGSFVGMQTKHALRIVLVRPGRGTGIEPPSVADRSVVYDGHRITVHLDGAS